MDLGGGNAYNILLVVFVTLGSLGYGYSASIIATTLGQPSFTSYFGLDIAPNATSIIGAMNFLFQFGGLVGCLSSSLLQIGLDENGRWVLLRDSVL